ncbi:co-chaperone GroES [Candidatus Pacearchaeota archaeon]|nr:co-chaperone GroES [Candidatus Pacearchaeota archaeon]
MNIKPLGERVLIKQAKTSEERTKSGLYIPKSNSERKEGTIIAVGAMNDGRPLPVKPGDHVIYGGYSSEELEIDGEKHIMVELKDIIAMVE